MKKGMTFIWGLVEVILVIVVFLILLQTGLLKVIMGMIGQKTLCEASFIASSMSRTFGKMNIDPHCKTHKILITDSSEIPPLVEQGSEKKSLNMDYIQPTLPNLPLDTFLRVKEWNKQFPGNKYPYISECGADDPELATEDEQACVTKRYNMDYFLADELKYCWDIVGQGKLPLFDNWFEFLNCPDKQCKSALDYFKGLKEPHMSAEFCVLCSRIKFDENVKFDNGPYDSINHWMYNNRYKLNHKTSYFEYVQDEGAGFFEQRKFAYSTDKPYAVVFVRVNFQQPVEWLSRVYGIFDKDLDKFPYVTEGKDKLYYFNDLRLIPYDQLSDPDTCDYIVGSYI
jgi:hypothetical protein